MKEIKNKTGNRLISNEPPNTGPDYASLRQHFKKLVTETHAALIVERSAPRLVPALTVTGTVLSGTWLFNMWSHLPPGLPRGLAVLGWLAATAAPFIFTKGKSLFVRKREAIRLMDDMSGNPHRPASALASVPPRDMTPEARALWDKNQKTLLTEALPKLTAHKPDWKVGRSWTYALALSALTAFGSGLWAGNERIPRLMEAFNFTAPPVIPAPLVVKAWVTPPKGFGLKAEYLQENNTNVSAHEQSTLHISVIGQKPKVTLNGQEIALGDPLVSPETGEITYQYKPTQLGEGQHIIAIAGGPRWEIGVDADNTPLTAIREMGTNKDGNLEIRKCEASDDHKIAGGRIILGVPGRDKKDPKDVLPTARLPAISLPGGDFCGNGIAKPDGP
ncbi:MAG: DUF4175 domain-containing protein [Alphaproteobacteria bacterium]|nr:DUF4175 domain-containing protein [Alphaproteobacteria bacterium]MCD8571616.1 DUF4175 domain-containing protein [Alphaproteobacteria bacterium]